MTNSLSVFFKAITSSALGPLALTVCLISAAPAANASEDEKQHLYSGALGGRPLVLRVFEGRRPYPLEALDGVKAQYFFPDDGKLVTLRTRTDGWLEECSVEYNNRIQCNSTGSLWRFSRPVSGDLDLVRRNSAVGTVTVLPMRALADGASNPLCEGPEVQGKRQTMGGISFAWVTDPRSGVKVVKLLGGLPLAKLQEFNRQRSAQLKALSCEELEMLPYGGGTESAKKVHFASKKFLSVGGIESYYSGGTTGNQGQGVETYDLVSLRAIRAEQLFKSVRGSESTPTHSKAIYSLKIAGTPRYLEDLIWQEGWKLVKRLRLLQSEALDENAYDPQFADTLETWFAQYSSCEWDAQDKPLRCELGSGTLGTQVMLTRKGLAVLIHVGKSLLGDFTIPWNRAAAVLKPGVTLE